MTHCILVQRRFAFKKRETIYGYFRRIKVVTIPIEETKILEIVARSCSRSLVALLR